MPSAAKKRAKQRKKPGRKAGQKALSVRKRGVVAPSGSGAAARGEIRRLLAAASTVPGAEHTAIEREWVGLVASQARLQAQVEAEVASNEDHRELRRTIDRLDKLRRRVSPEAPPSAPKLEPLEINDRRAFCEAHLTVADGGPYSLKGREWLQTQFWDVLDGFRLWPVDRANLCGSCAGLAGRIVASVYAAVEAHGDCRGLRTHVVWLVCLQLKRQQGKTTGVAGYVCSSLFRWSHESIAYIAGSEDQSTTLTRANFGAPLKASPLLADRVDVQNTRLIVAETQSEFEVRPTSFAGTTGGSRTLAIVDEARDVPGDVFTALVPQIYARNGWRCPTGKPGHAWSSGDLAMLEGFAVDPKQQRWGQTCNTCGAKVEPWCGRVVAMSSAQVLDGSSADWFEQLCAQLEAEPEADAHVFRTTQVVNPKVSRELVGRTEAVLGKVSGLRDSIAVEAGGVSRRKGEPFLSPAVIVAREDKTLVSRMTGIRPAVGFLDTSDVSELTSCNAFEDDGGPKRWDLLAQSHLEIWDPREQPGGRIDDRVVEDHVSMLITGGAFEVFVIDDRLRPWARAMLVRLRQKFPHIVRGCDTKGEKWGAHERRLGWSKLFERYTGATIRTLVNERLREELKGARRFDRTDGSYDVHELNRRVNHLDVAEGVAACCYIAHELSVVPTRVGLADIERRGAAGALAKLRSRRPLAPRAGDY